MNFKKLIPLFLILVLSIQFLPLQLIAAWLSSGQVTEEITHAQDAAKSKSPLYEKDPVLLLQFFNTGGQTLLMSVLNKFHSDETLMIRDADEILTPPPNE
jgi:flagellar basal body-associated protein FliL